MITDLFRDWVNGEPTEWHHFVPTVYLLEFHLHHFHLNLYANDQNIIDKPLIKEENSVYVYFLAISLIQHPAVSHGYPTWPPTSGNSDDTVEYVSPRSHDHLFRS